MPKPLQNPKYSDLWYGTGGPGRFATQGRQSYLPPQRSAWDWTNRWSQTGLRNLLEKHGIEFDYERNQPLPQPVEPVEPQGPQEGINQAPLIERGSEGMLDPDVFRRQMLQQQFLGMTPEDFQALEPQDIQGQPLVNLTGSYNQGYDFSNLPKYAMNFEKLTPFEQLVQHTLGSDKAQAVFTTAENLGKVADEIVKAPAGLYNDFGWVGKLAAGPAAVLAGGAAYAKWSAGNLMWVLDSGAEFVERVQGTSYQVQNDPEFMQFRDQLRRGSLSGFTTENVNRLAAAWQASSLYYDNIAPPLGAIIGVKDPTSVGDFLFPAAAKTIFYASGIFSYLAGPTAYAKWLEINDELTDEEREQFMNVYYRSRQHWQNVFEGEGTEVGGLPALIQARKLIQEGATLEEVRGIYTEEIGALALRGQLFDTGMHTVVDPINFILPRLRVGEKIRAARILLENSRVDPVLAGAIGDIAPIARGLSDAFGAGVRPLVEDVSGDVARLSELAAKANIPELTNAVGMIEAGGEGMADGVQIVNRIVENMQEVGRLSNKERVLWGVLGQATEYGAPSKRETAFLNLTDPSRWLTSQSRASMYIQNFTDNVRVLLAGKTVDPEDIVAIIKRASAGAFGGTFGHMMITPQGRAIQSTLQAYGNKADELLRIWMDTAAARGSAENIAEILGTDTVSLLARMKNSRGVQEVFDELVTTLRGLEDPTRDATRLLGQIDEGLINQKHLADIASALAPTKDGRIVPVTAEAFRSVLVSEITEEAARSAVNIFGLKTEGVAERALNSVRAAESLMLLGLNPKYPIQNFFNNEVTMMARGIWNTYGMDTIKRFWQEGYGYTPSRLTEAFGTIAGDLTELTARGNIEAALGAGYKVISEAVKAPPTAISKFAMSASRKVRSIFPESVEVLGKTVPVRSQDFRTIAAGIESSARARAMTAGMMRSWDVVWRPNIGFTLMDDLIPGFSDELRAINPDLADLVVDVVTNARKGEDIDQIIRGVSDWRMNYETLVRKTAEAEGMNVENVRRILDTELGNSIRDRLADLPANPELTDINSVFDDVLEAQQQQFDDFSEMSVPLIKAEAATIVNTQGPQGVWSVWSDTFRLIFERHVDHFAQLDVGIGRINRATPSFQRLEWDNLLGNTTRDWTRTWDAAQAKVDGIVEGLREAGFAEETATGISEGFASLRRVNEEYFALRNTSWADYYAKSWTPAQIASGKKEREYQRILTLLDKKYDELINANMAHWQRIDDAFIRLTDTPSAGTPLFQNLGENRLGEAVRNWRAMLRDARLNDMRDVRQFRASLEGLSRNDRTLAWEQFNSERYFRLEYINKLEQQGGQGIFSGNENVLAYFLNQTQTPLDDVRLVDTLISNVSEESLRRALTDIPGGNQILAQIDAAPDPAKALDDLRNAYRGENVDDLIRQTDTLYTGAAKEDVIAQAERLFGYDRVDADDADALRRLTDRYLSGEAAPEIMQVRREFKVERLGGTGLQGRPAEDATAAADDMFALSYKNQAFLVLQDGHGGWQLELPDGTIIGRAGRDGSAELIDQARRMVEANVRNQWMRETFGDRVTELNKFSDILEVSSKDLDPELSGIVQRYADQMANDLATERGGDLYVSAASDPNSLGMAQTKNPVPWYSDLLAQHGTELSARKSSLIGALNKIASGTEYIKSGANAGELANSYIPMMREALLDWMRREMQASPEAFDILKARDVLPSMPNPVRGPDSLSLEDTLRMLIQNGNDMGDGIPAGLFDNLMGVNAPRRGEAQTFLNNIDDMVGRQEYPGEGLDSLSVRHQRNIIEALRNHAHAIRQSPPPDLFDLPPEIMGKLLRYTDHVKGELNTARITATKMAESISDGALLNYTKQYKWDAFASYFFPYHYWYTHSMAAWMAHSIDRPAMLGTYYKMKRFLDQAHGTGEGMPARLQGKLKFNLPFAPDWMGDWYVDPLRSFGLPFEGFIQPWEEWGKALNIRDQGTERVLAEMLRTRQITQEEYDAAIAAKSGALWQQATGIARTDNESGEFSLYDFLSMSTSPHLPYQIAWNAWRGTPENITPLPFTRTIKSIADLIGVPPGWYDNTWGNIRKFLGLPGFDQFDDYRVNRELSSMVGEGLITIDQHDRARIDGASNPLYVEAQQRVNRTSGLRWLVSLLGLPVINMTDGERELRSLNDEFQRALEIRDNGNPDALTDFFNQHPEYETRLGLFDDPQTFLRKTLWEQVLNTYYGLSSLDRATARDKLGEDFVSLVLDSDTWAPDNVPMEQVAMWIKMMGGDAVGELGKDALPLTFAAPEVAAKAQVYYDFRNTYFPDYFRWNDEFNKLPQNIERAEFREQNPMYDRYKTWQQEVFPEYSDMMEQFTALDPNSPQDRFLQDYPELQNLWDEMKEKFPDYKVQSQQYANTPDYLKEAYRRAHPELVAAWEFRDSTLPAWRDYYDYFFGLSDQSQRDFFIDINPKLQWFWDAREEQFPGIGDIIKAYSALPYNSERADYLVENPGYQAYLDWKKDFMNSNPAIAPFISDEWEPNYGTIEDVRAAGSGQPQFTWQEWSTQMSIPLQETVLDYILDGEPLPDAAETLLNDLAVSMGLTYEEALYLIEQSLVTQ